MVAVIVVWVIGRHPKSLNQAKNMPEPSRAPSEVIERTSEHNKRPSETSERPFYISLKQLEKRAEDL